MTMSNERQPMLSDAKLTGRDHGPEPSHDSRDGNDWINWWGKMNDTPNMNPWEVRDHYESLITTGKLRVVDEVQYDRGGCLKCGNVDDHGTQWKTWVSCPGCGNKIKR